MSRHVLFIGRCEFTPHLCNGHLYGSTLTLKMCESHIEMRVDFLSRGNLYVSRARAHNDNVRNDTSHEAILNKEIINTILVGVKSFEFK